MDLPYTTRFRAVADLAALIDVHFSNSRMNRLNQTISYDVTVTNKGDHQLVLPLLLVLHPADGYAGIPVGAEGVPDQHWLISLEENVPNGSVLQPGETTSGRTITVVTPDGQRVDFTTSISTTTGPNAAPVFVSPPVEQATAGDAYFYLAIASDPEDSAVTYLLLDGPEGMTVHASSGQVQWSPTSASPVESAIVLRAYDPQGAWAQQEFVITVSGGNYPPVFEPQPRSVTRQPGMPLVFQVGATDADGDPLRYWATNLPPGAIFDPETRALYWTPQIADAGIHREITFVVSDGLAETTALLDVIVAAVNPRPHWSIPAPACFARGDTLQFSLRATNPSGSTVTYAAAGLPDGATLHPLTGELRWTPGYDQHGFYEVMFSATANGLTDSRPGYFVVLDVNGPPQFDPIDRWRVFEGQEIAFRVLARDPDNPTFVPPTRLPDGSLAYAPGTTPTVTYHYDGWLPVGAAFDVDTGMFRWRPGYDQAGDWEVTFTATDGRGGEESISVPIRVDDVNRPPVLTVADQAAVVGWPLQFTLTGTDPDGDTLTYRAERLPDGAMLDAATGQFDWTPRPGQVGDFAITFLVSDGQATARRTALLRVTAAPVAPHVHIELTPSFAVAPNQQVQVRVSASSLAGIASLQLWADGQPVSLDGQGRAWFTTTEPGKIYLEAVATDAKNMTGQTSTWLKVLDPDDHLAPVVSFAAGVANAVVSAPFDVRGAVADANLDRWILEIAPWGTQQFTQVASGNNVVDGTLTTLDPARWHNGFYHLRLRAQDIGERSTAREVKIEVASAVKSGIYRWQETDLTVPVGAHVLAVTRMYDSLNQNLTASFGNDWRWAEGDFLIHTEVPSLAS